MSMFLDMYKIFVILIVHDIQFVFSFVWLLYELCTTKNMFAIFK